MKLAILLGGAAAIGLGGATAIGLGSAALADPPTPSDQAFVQQIYLENLTEIREARYVMQNTKNPDARAYASQAIDDHSSANVKLAAMARKAGLHAPEMTVTAPPMDPPGGPLAGLTGRKLVAAYFSAEVTDERTILGQLQAEQADATASPALKTFAAQVEPVVRQHIVVAMQVVQGSPGGPVPGSDPNGNNTAAGPGGNSSANPPVALPPPAQPLPPSTVNGTTAQSAASPLPSPSGSPAPNAVPTKSPSP
jgi:putative membrane protein